MFRTFSSLIALAILVFSTSTAYASPEAALSADTVKPIAEGVSAPAFQVKHADGTVFDFNPDALEKKQLIIFYRGGWCPYCNRHLQALQDVVPKLRAADIDVLFLSADKPELLYSSLDEPDIDYTLLSDAAMTAARAFGVAFRIDDETFEKYKGFGIDLEAASGFDHHELPVPAVYLIDTQGKVVFRHADANYKVRLKSEVILQAAGL